VGSLLGAYEHEELSVQHNRALSVRDVIHVNEAHHF
jgi:hypothetical protein